MPSLRLSRATSPTFGPLTPWVNHASKACLIGKGRHPRRMVVATGKIGRHKRRRIGPTHGTEHYGHDISPFGNTPGKRSLKRFFPGIGSDLALEEIADPGEESGVFRTAFRMILPGCFRLEFFQQLPLTLAQMRGRLDDNLNIHIAPRG